MSPVYWQRNSDQRQLLFKKTSQFKKIKSQELWERPSWPPASRDEPVELGRASQGDSLTLPLQDSLTCS